MTIDAAALRAELTEIRTASDRRDAVIAAGADAGISKTDLAELSGLSRQHIYDVLARHAEAKKAAAADEVAQVAALWKLGQVVEDRWGLRWRADCIDGSRFVGDETRRWQCRSVGLRVSLPHAKMAERGPLKLVRVDVVFAGPLGSPEQVAVEAAREAGEAEDAAVTVEPHG